MFRDIKITKETREDVRHRLLPAAVSFSRNINGYAFEDDIDCLDRVCIEGELDNSEVFGRYRLICASGSDTGHIICSYITLPAAGMLTEVRRCLDEAGMGDVTVRMSKWKSEEGADEEFERTRWDLSFDFEVPGSGGLSDLSSIFEDAYNKLCRASEVCMMLYINNENMGFARKKYIDFIGFSSDETLEYDDTALERMYCSLLGMETYSGKLTDGMNTSTIEYSRCSIDITSTTVMVQTTKAEMPSAAIYLETELVEEEIPKGLAEFDYEQAFSIGRPHGRSRYILYGSDVIAKVYCPQADVFIIRPLDIYFMNEYGYGRSGNDAPLVAVRDDDGTFRFFAEMYTDESPEGIEKGMKLYRMAGYAGPDSYDQSSEYTAAVTSVYEHLLPIIAAAEAWAFEPDPGSEEEDESSAGDTRSSEESRIDSLAEERWFDRLNEDTHKAFAIVRKWMNQRPAFYTIKHNYDEIYDEWYMDADSAVRAFFSNPASSILRLLKDDCPMLYVSYIKGNDSQLTEDMFFVQSTKNRAYGLISDHGLMEIEGKMSRSKQIRITDLM